MVALPVPTLGTLGIRVMVERMGPREGESGGAEEGWEGEGGEV